MARDKSIQNALAYAGGDTRNSPDDLFLRYCRGRVRHLPLRLVMVLIGAAALALVAGLETGLGALILALLGEFADCAVLRTITNSCPQPPVRPLARNLASLSSIFQAATIAGAATMVLNQAQQGDADFFVCAFLAAAIINAGLSLPHHAGSAIARILVHTATFGSIALHNIMMFSTGRMVTDEWIFDLVGMTVLMLMSWGFVAYVRGAQARQIVFDRALLAEKAQLMASRAQLEEKERHARRLALVAENANDSVVITGPDGRITWVNETFTKITGYSFDEAIGHTPAELLNSADTDAETVRRLVDAHLRKVPLRIEVLNRRKDGATIWMETSLTPIFNPDGSHAMTIGVERDISVMKEREAELARAWRAAEDAARARTAFLATMSHEIRTPMNGVIGMAELLSETELTPDQRQGLTTIVDSGRALLTIINDILDLTRLQSGKPVIRSEPFRIDAVIAGVADLLRPLAREKGLDLALTCPVVPPVLMGDAGRLRQIVMNLAGNAVKFTETGKVGLTLSVAFHDASATVEVSVQDTGIGISEDRLDKIFDSFTQADSDISRRFGGTGLGLTISRLLAREMGGDITVRSQLGGGSLFLLSLTLPLAAGKWLGSAPAATSTQVVPPAPRTTADKSAPSARLRVLVAEDNATNRMIVGKMLAATDVEISFVGDGAAAVERCCEWRPHVVLMDLSMPGMDGLEATRRIRLCEADSQRPPARIVALTANAFEEDREASLAAGCDAFLSKPISKAALVSAIRVPARESEAIGL